MFFLMRARTNLAKSNGAQKTLKIFVQVNSSLVFFEQEFFTLLLDKFVPWGTSFWYKSSIQSQYIGKKDYKLTCYCKGRYRKSKAISLRLRVFDLLFISISSGKSFICFFEYTQMRFLLGENAWVTLIGVKENRDNIVTRQKKYIWVKRKTFPC